MSVAKSEFTADLLISILTNEPNLPLYMGLLVSEVNGDKEPQVKTSEVADPAYQRQQVCFSAIEGSFVQLLHDIQFPKASRKWERVTHFGVWDSHAGGNLVLLKPTGGVNNVEVGEAIAILTTEFQLYVGQNACSG